VDTEKVLGELIATFELRPRISTSVDMPLPDDAKRALKHAADQADVLKYRYVGTEHLLLGILNESSAECVQILARHGITYERVLMNLRHLTAAPKDCATTEYPH
jgi:ATP-dependent Clp protease ATP-binding subunit ClpC